MNAEPRRMLGRERDALIAAMLDAYQTTALVNEFVKNRLNPIPGTEIHIRSLDMVSTDRDAVPERLGALIDYAIRHDVVDEVVREAHRGVPTNFTLKRFHADYFASVQRQLTPQLERQVVIGSRYIEPAEWREELERAERRVCRIQTPAFTGTGFLVAPDVVLTNHHVVAELLAAPHARDECLIQFDYKPPRSVDVAVHAEWQLALSPPSGSELGTPDGGDPDTGHLDFAFVRLARRVGEDAVASVRRGWFALPSSTAPIALESPVNILQYPEGVSIKLAIDMRSVIEVNANRTRVKYRTRTDFGSSGAPCFDQDWRVIALHHSGDPNFKRAAEYNQGIPVDTIVSVLPPALRTELGTV